MNRSHLSLFGLIAVNVLSLISATFNLFAGIGATIERVFLDAFPATETVERQGLPSLISTNANVTSIGAARTDAFVTRRHNRTVVGRRSGDPCSSLAFAA